MDETFEKIVVIGVYRNFEREIIFFEDAIAAGFLLIHVDVVMDEVTVACGGVGGERRYQIQMPGPELMRLPVDDDSCFTLYNIVDPCERAANVLPVPVGFMYGFSYIEEQWMKRVDVHR